jgi:hypothetical protein
MNVGELIAYLKLDKSNFESGMDAAQSKAKATGEVMKGIGEKMTMFITAPLVAFAGFSIKAWTESQNALSKLTGVLKSTGNVIGYTTDQLEEFATQIQDTTGFEDDMIINAEAIMATFTSIGHDVFPQAIKAAADMSAVMGTDLQGSVIQLGKALQDPITGLTALRRVGVNFNATQKETIAQFVEMGDVVSAQNIILAELNREFGNVAATMMKTDTGALKALGNDFGNLQEDIGRLILESLRPLIDIAREVIKWFTGLDDGVKKTIIAIGGVIAIVGPLMIVLGALFTMIASNPIGLVITALVALTAGIITAVSTTTSEMAKLEKERDAIGEKNRLAAEKVSNAIVDGYKKEYEAGLKTQKQIIDETNKRIKSYEDQYLSSKDTYSKMREQEIALYILKQYFSDKEEELAFQKRIDASKWLGEQKKIQEEFNTIKLSDYDKELKKLNDQYTEYKKYKMNQKELDEWYLREKKKIDEKGGDSESERLKENEQMYNDYQEQKVKDTQRSLERETKKTEEETEKQKQFWADLGQSIMDVWNGLGSVMSAYFAAANSELANQWTNQMQAGEDFEAANRDDIESKIYNLNLEKEKYLAAGIDKNKVDAWYNKQLNKIRDKATDEEKLRIDEVKTEQEAAAKEDYVRTRDIAMKKYKLEVDAFNWNKAASIVGITIATIQGVMAAAARAELFPFNFILAGIIGAMGVIQGSLVAAQQPPPPPAFNKGGWFDSPDTGIDRGTARLTAGEFVVNKESSARNASLLENINNGGNVGGNVTLNPIPVNIYLADGRLIGKADIEFIEQEAVNGGFTIPPKAIRARI